VPSAAPGLAGCQAPRRVAERLVGGVGHRPGLAGQHPQQRVAVRQAGHPGHLILFLEHQPVAGPPGDLVQRVPDVQDGLVGGPDPGPRRGGHPGGGHRLDGVHVAQAAPGLLQVGFEQEGELTEALLARGGQGVQLRQPGTGRRPPVFERPLAQPGAQPGIAGDVPRLQQPERHREVGRRGVPGLGRGAHRVVEPGARVPDRVPDPVRDAADAGHAVVQQQQVEVAARQQLAAPEPAHREQRDPGLGRQQPGQPAVRAGRPARPVGGERRHHTRRRHRLTARPGRAPRCGP